MNHWRLRDADQNQEMPGWGEDLCRSGRHRSRGSARWSEVDLAGHLRCRETVPEGVKNASAGV